MVKETGAPVLPEDVYEPILQFVPTDTKVLLNVSVASKKLYAVVNKPEFWSKRLTELLDLIDFDLENKRDEELSEWYQIEHNENAKKKMIAEIGAAGFEKKQQEMKLLSKSGIFREWKHEMYWNDDEDGEADGTKSMFTPPFEFWRNGIAHKQGQFSTFEGWSMSKIARFIKDIKFLKTFAHKIREVRYPSESDYPFIPFILEGEELKNESEAGIVDNDNLLETMGACGTLKEHTGVLDAPDDEEEEDDEDEEEEQPTKRRKVGKGEKQEQRPADLVEIDGSWKKADKVKEKDLMQLLLNYAGTPNEDMLLFQAGGEQVNPFPVYAVVRSKTGNYVGAIAGGVWT